ncbi:MAG: hypothetical protein OEY23_05540 [Acidimicrobiia bacterium]|nr:hypothetical protein [Acidimicrobiia bacterium]
MAGIQVTSTELDAAEGRSAVGRAAIDGAGFALVQQSGLVAVRFDGDGHARVWSPNVRDPAERIDVDLAPFAAVLIEKGIGRPAPEARWDDTGQTLIVSLDLGSIGGVVRIDGVPVSGRAATALLAAGFLRTITEHLEALANDRPAAPPPERARDGPTGGHAGDVTE